MGGGGLTIRANKQRRQKIPERLVSILGFLAVHRIPQADNREFGRDVGAVDFAAKARAQPCEEITDMVGVRVRQEEGVKGLGRDWEAFDVVRERIAFALKYAAIDCEALTAGRMEDEVGGTRDRTAGPERLIKERRGRERVVCR